MLLFKLLEGASERRMKRLASDAGAMQVVQSGGKLHSLPSEEFFDDLWRSLEAIATELLDLDARFPTDRILGGPPPRTRKVLWSRTSETGGSVRFVFEDET